MLLYVSISFLVSTVTNLWLISLITKVAKKKQNEYINQMLEIKQLHKSYPIGDSSLHVLKGIDLSADYRFKDRKILYELDKNCWQSNSQIAKKVSLSKQVTNYRIKRLEEHAIHKFISFFIIVLF